MGNNFFTARAHVIDFCVCIQPKGMEACVPLFWKQWYHPCVINYVGTTLEDCVASSWLSKHWLHGFKLPLTVAPFFWSSRGVTCPCYSSWSSFGKTCIRAENETSLELPWHREAGGISWTWRLCPVLCGHESLSVASAALAFSVLKAPFRPLPYTILSYIVNIQVPLCFLVMGRSAREFQLPRERVSPCLRPRDWCYSCQIVTVTLPPTASGGFLGLHPRFWAGAGPGMWSMPVLVNWSVSKRVPENSTELPSQARRPGQETGLGTTSTQDGVEANRIVHHPSQSRFSQRFGFPQGALKAIK